MRSPSSDPLLLSAGTLPRVVKGEQSLIEIAELHAKIGQLTTENDSSSWALGRISGGSAEYNGLSEHAVRLLHQVGTQPARGGGLR